MKHNCNLIYVDNVKIAHLIYNFIQERIDHHLTSYSGFYLTHNEQTSISNVSQVIESELYSYLSTLINKHLPYSITKNIGPLPVFLEFLITKWNPVIKEELEQKINYINLIFYNKKEAS